MQDKKMPSHHGPKARLSGQYPNETIKILTERASCRIFKAKQIPNKVMNTLFEVATHAATGGNLQPYSIIKIADRKVKDDLAKKCGQAFIGQAPVDLLFCIDWYRLKRWAVDSRNPCHTDASGSSRRCSSVSPRA